MADPTAPQSILDRVAAIELELRSLRSPQPPAGWPTTFDPVWTQGATITHTVVRNEFLKDKRLVQGVVNLQATSGGTAATVIRVTAPFTAKWGSNSVVGAGWHDNGTVKLPLLVHLNVATAFSFQPAFTADTVSYGINQLFYPTAAGANTAYTPTVANAHTITFCYSYESVG